MAHPHGLFIWTDVTLPDPAAGAAFYKAIFGWDAEQASTDEDMPYWMFSLDGKSSAGMGEQSVEMKEQGVPPMWNSYVNVDDVEAAVARVLDLGGTVLMPPIQIFESGKMAMIADPGGAALALWEAGDHTGADEYNTPGFLSWNELATRDLPGAIAFYEALFGWTTHTQDMGGGMEYTSFHVGDRPNGGAYDAAAFLPDSVPAHWGVYFTVDDCDATAANVRENGGSVVREPSDTPVGRMAVCADPQGAPFMVIALTAAA